MNRTLERHYRLLRTELQKFTKSHGYYFAIEDTPCAEIVEVCVRNDVNGWRGKVHLDCTDADFSAAILQITAEAQKELTRMKKLIGKHDDSVDALFYSTLYSNKKKLTCTPYALRIKNVIFNDPATIVFWEDGTKTVVKAIDEKFDPEKGLAMAISKKALGNHGNYYNVFTKWCPEEEEDIPDIRYLYPTPMITVDEEFRKAVKDLFNEFFGANTDK